MKVAELKSAIAKGWEGTPAATISLAIVDFTAALPSDQRAMLTFRTITKIAGRPNVDEDVIAAVMILVSSKVAAFDLRALFVDDSDDEFEIDPETLAAARSEGALAHPVSGQLVEEFEHRLIPFITPAASFEVHE